MMVLQCEKEGYKSVYNIYPKELKAGAQPNICMPMFLTDLFTKAKAKITQVSIDGSKDKQNTSWNIIQPLKR